MKLVSNSWYIGKVPSNCLKVEAGTGKEGGRYTERGNEIVRDRDRDRARAKNRDET